MRTQHIRFMPDGSYKNVTRCRFCGRFNQSSVHYLKCLIRAWLDL